MLTSSIMGWVALWILWGNTALVALAALRRAAGLLRRARALSPRALAAGAASLEAKVVAADDPSGKLAELEVEQVGRLGAGTEASIVFHDRAHRSRAFGGEVETITGERVRIEPTDEAEVWLDEDDVRAAAAAPAAARFDDAASQAKKARGYTNLVRVPVSVGDRVFVAGRATGGATKTIAPSEGGALVIAKIDPSAWARRRALAVMLGFVPAIFAAAGVATALALVPPVFDSLYSKLGGALGLAHFLLVLPAGTAARDWMRMPFERFVRGSWSAPRAGAAERAASS